MPEESPSTQIAWRLNPQISYSDWILQVTRMPNDLLFSSPRKTKQIDTYHVHKTHLSCGPRKSIYFFGLFHNKNKDSSNNTTRIQLQDSVADAVPHFLDYVYGYDLQFNVDLAVALHYLSDYFGVEPLKQEVFDFVRTNMITSSHPQKARLILLEDNNNNTTAAVMNHNDDDDKENRNPNMMEEDSESVILESCMKSATRWNLVRDRLLSAQNHGLVELVTQMLTLEQKNLLFFYALREQSNGRRHSVQEWKVQNQVQLVTEAQEMIRVQEEMAELKEQLESLKNQNEAYSHAFGRLKQDLQQLESKNEKLEERAKEMDRLVQQVADLKKTKDQQEQESYELQKQVEELQLTKTSLEHERNTQASKLSVLYSSAERLERKLTKAKAKNQNMVSTKEQLELVHQSHLQEISRLKGESSKLVYQLQVEASRWHEQAIKLKRQCELLEELYWTGSR